MTAVDVVHGLVPEGEELEATLTDLEGHGLFPSEIVVAHPPPGRYELADETLHEDLSGARNGALLGGLAGLALGLAIAAVVPGVAEGGAASLLTAAAAVAGLGALVGAMIGLQRHERNDDDPVRWRELTGSDGLCCVTVRCEQRTAVAHRVLERHGAEFLESAESA